MPPFDEKRGPPEPKSGRTGRRLTDEMLTQRGFIVGHEIDLVPDEGQSENPENPFKILSVDHHSDNIERGVIIESTKTGTRYVIVPSQGFLDMYEYNEGDYERALENEEPPAGELIQHVNKKMY